MPHPSALHSRVDRTLFSGSDRDPFRYPRSHDEWIDWYQYRIDATHGDTYGQQLIKDLQLFRALDDDGKVIAITRRLFNDVAFVVNVAVSALALDQLTLTGVDDADEGDVALAKSIWRRSKPARFGESWARTLCATGDYGLEPVAFRATPGPGTVGRGVRLIGHDPRTLFMEYDEPTGTELERVIITHNVLGEATVDAYGGVSEVGELVIHQRTLTGEAVTVTSKDERHGTGLQIDDVASGPHGLGVVPFAHLAAVPFTEAEHSLWVGHGLDRPLAEIDSLFSQISAIGDRFANPKLVVIGAKIGDSSAMSKFGRILNIHGASKEKLAGVKVSYLEPSLQAVGVLADRIDAMLEQIRQTMPEFLFSGSAAGLSGEALKLLATRYVSKYRAIRARVYGGIEVALAMGVALERSRPYDPDSHPVTVTGPALLPADTKGEAETVSVARSAGMMNARDAVRHGQRLGLASGDVDAGDYLAAMREDDGTAPIPQPADPDDTDPGESAG